MAFDVRSCRKQIVFVVAVAVGIGTCMPVHSVSADAAAGGHRLAFAPSIPTDVQPSLISFAIKAGAKRVSKNTLKSFIKTRIKDRLGKLTNKKLARELAEEADQILGMLQDPWWSTAIGFIPVVGDAFDLVRVPSQIRQALGRADALEDKVQAALDAEHKAHQAVQAASSAARHVPAPAPRAPIISVPTSSPANVPAAQATRKGAEAAARGLAREARVAKIVGGRVSRQPIKTRFGSTDLDVIGPAGELIAVGGPAKARDLSKLGRELKILQEAASQRGVATKAAFERGTPQAVIDLAIKKLGRHNVIIFDPQENRWRNEQHVCTSWRPRRALLNRCVKTLR